MPGSYSAEAATTNARPETQDSVQEWIARVFPDADALLETRDGESVLESLIRKETAWSETLAMQSRGVDAERAATATQLAAAARLGLERIDEGLPALLATARKGVAVASEATGGSGALPQLFRQRAAVARLKRQRKHVAAAAEAAELLRALPANDEDKETDAGRALGAIGRLLALRDANAGPTRLSSWLVAAAADRHALLRSRLAQRLRTALEAFRWPQEALPTGETSLVVSQQLAQVRTAYSDACALSPLESSDISDASVLSYGMAGAARLQLGPEVLAEALVRRFEFHFCTPRPTNRLDKPEWFFADIAKTLATHAATCQALHARSDALAQLALALLRAVAAKLRADVPLLVARPALITHYLVEAAQFDRLVRGIAFRDASAAPGVRGTCLGLLQRCRPLVDAWVAHVLQDETVKFGVYADPGVSLLEPLLADGTRTDRGDFDADDDADDDAAPVVLCGPDALVAHVLEGPPALLADCASPRLALALLVHVQLPLLERFLGVLSALVESAEALAGRPWLSMVGSGARSASGEHFDGSAELNGEELNNGRSGETSNATTPVLPEFPTSETGPTSPAVILDADADDAAIDPNNAAERARAQFPELAKKLSVASVAARVAGSLAYVQRALAKCADSDYYCRLGDAGSAGATGGLFAVARDFARLRERAERAVVHELMAQLRAGAAAYVRKRQWPAMPDAIAPAKDASNAPTPVALEDDPFVRQLSVSPELHGPLLALSHALDAAVRPFVPPERVRHAILAQLATALERWFSASVLFSAHFSEPMACQLWFDVRHGLAAALHAGAPVRYLKQLLEMVRLLAVPARGSPRERLYAAADAGAPLNLERLCELVVAAEASSGADASAPDSPAYRLVAALESIGVFNLGLSDIKDVFRRRSDCPWSF